jgi:tripartite-type tricarboxylate transporter receptor subunit TctC
MALAALAASARAEAPGAAAAGLVPQGWPAHVVKIVATSPPGGSVDLLARLLAEGFSRTFGQPFIVDNRPGANGNIGVDAVVKGPPDGYLLFVTIPGVFCINMHLQQAMPFNPRTDLLPIAMVGYSPLVLLAGRSVPAGDLGGLLDWLRRNPGKASYSSAGVGTTGHLGMELFRSMTGVQIVHVPYKGAAGAMTDLLAGNVDLALNNTSASVPYIEKGEVRAIAVAERHRIASLPKVPTFDEAGLPGFEVTPWFGLGTRAGVDPGIIDTLAREAVRILAQPAVSARLQTLGMEPRTMVGAPFRAYIAAESDRWGAIIRQSGARAE